MKLTQEDAARFANQFEGALATQVGYLGITQSHISMARVLVEGLANRKKTDVGIFMDNAIATMQKGDPGAAYESEAFYSWSRPLHIMRIVATEIERFNYLNSDRGIKLDIPEGAIGFMKRKVEATGNGMIISHFGQVIDEIGKFTVPEDEVRKDGRRDRR